MNLSQLFRCLDHCAKSFLHSLSILFFQHRCPAFISSLSSIHSLQTVSILLPPHLPSSILISSTRSQSPWPPLHTLSYFLSNPRTSLLAEFYLGLSSKPHFTTHTLRSPWPGLVFYKFYSLSLPFHLFFPPHPRNKGEAWRAGISILKQRKQKKQNTNWQAWNLMAALWILSAALSKRLVQPCETSH